METINSQTTVETRQVVKEVPQVEIRQQKDTSLKYFIIGIGNAGSQVAAVVNDIDKPEVRCFLINSSEKDLDDNVVNKDIPAFIIGNHRGAGRDRGTAKEFLKDSLATLFVTNEFIVPLNESDIIFVIASTAGGTGSGCGPMLVNRIQRMYPDKTVIFYGILPKHSESPQAQMNTLECLKEVTNTKFPMTYMLADLHTYENETSDIAYKKINNYIVETLKVLFGDYMNKSPYGMIDENDLLTIISETGYMAVYHIPNLNQTDIEHRTTQSILIDEISHGSAAHIQADKHVMKMGVIINTPSSAEDPSKNSNFEELEAYTGVPLDVFVNYAISIGSRGSMSLIMSGCSKPMDRITECTRIADKARALFENEDTDEVKDELEMLDFMSARNNSNITSKTRGKTYKNTSFNVTDFSDDSDIF